LPATQHSIAGIYNSVTRPGYHQRGQKEFRATNRPTKLAIFAVITQGTAGNKVDILPQSRDMRNNIR
jgi:hypothetical protein